MSFLRAVLPNFEAKHRRKLQRQLLTWKSALALRTFSLVVYLMLVFVTILALPGSAF